MAKNNRMPWAKSRPGWVVIILLLGDLLSIGLALACAAAIRQVAIPLIGGVIKWEVFIPLLALNESLIVFVFILAGLYPGTGRTAVEEMMVIFYSVTLGYGLLSLAVYFQQVSPSFPRSVFLMGWGLACVFDVAARGAIRNRFSLFRWWGEPIVVVGPRSEAADIIQRLNRSRRLGLRPAVLLDESASGDEQSEYGVPLLHTRVELQQVIECEKINYAIITGPLEQTARDSLRWVSQTFPTVLVVLEGSPLGSLWVKTLDLEGRLTLRGSYHLLDRHATIAKRIFDLSLSLVLCIVLSPLLLLITLLIRIDSPGPAFFRQERLGKKGRVINLLKFRTMSRGAQDQLAQLLENSPDSQQEFQRYHKLASDPRITRIGRLLRRYSLDELPQLWNILCGQMSLVGPRAYLPSERDEMGDTAQLILRIQPGLTGWWQVMGRHQTTFQNRLQLDEYYLSNWSLWLDIYIILKTAWVLLSGKGA